MELGLKVRVFRIILTKKKIWMAIKSVNRVVEIQQIWMAVVISNKKTRNRMEIPPVWGQYPIIKN
jgi:hypothetical protein